MGPASNPRHNGHEDPPLFDLGDLGAQLLVPDLLNFFFPSELISPSSVSYISPAPPRNPQISFPLFSPFFSPRRLQHKKSSFWSANSHRDTKTQQTSAPPLQSHLFNLSQPHFISSPSTMARPSKAAKAAAEASKLAENPPARVIDPVAFVRVRDSVRLN